VPLVAGRCIWAWYGGGQHVVRRRRGGVAAMTADFGVAGLCVGE
jgi:hypothetical protein